MVSMPVHLSPASTECQLCAENAIVLNESTAGDSHFNPIEIPHDPNTHRKRKHGSDGGDDRYKLQCRMESRQSSQSPFVPWVEATLYL